MRLFPLVVLLPLLACSTNPSSTRELQGRLATGSTQQQLVIIESAGAQSPATQRFVGAAQLDGTFVVNSPTNIPVRMLVATAGANGSFTVTGHLAPGRFTVPTGDARLNLGVVHQVGTAVTLVENPGTTTPDHMCPTPGTTPTAGDARLPYDVRPALGSTFKLDDAFLAEGPLPTKVVSVTMDNPAYRLTELQTDTAFTITQADCDHQGNRDIGRDRIFVTWQNADGSQQTDHLDIRYCDGSGGSSSSGGGMDGDSEGEGGSSSGDDGDKCEKSDDPECGNVEVEGCGETELTCDGASQLESADGSSEDDACATPTDGGTPVSTPDAGTNPGTTAGSPP